MRTATFAGCASRSAGEKYRSDEPGAASRCVVGLGGLGSSGPVQLGQTCCRISAAHLAQNVHSYEQILASVASGARFVSQCSQLGLRSSISMVSRG